MRLSLGGSTRRRTFRGRGRRGYRPRTNGFRGTVATGRTSFTIPRSLYLPVPAVMYTSVKLVLTDQLAIAAGPAVVFDVQDLLCPYRLFGGANHFAEYVQPLGRIYSKGQVMKVVSQFQFQNIGNNALEAVLVNLNQGTVAGIALGADGFDQLCAHPESRYGMMASAAGGRSQITLTAASDLPTLLGSGPETDTAYTTTLAGGFANPPIQVAANNANPQSIACVFNRAAAAGAVIVRRVFTFSIKFSDRHAQTQL